MTVTCTVDADVAEIRMIRPDKLNALDETMVDAFHAALDDTGAARAIVVTAEGRAFSAGRDLSAAEPLTEDAEAILRDTFNPLLLRISDLDVPTIAAVQGACLGVGFGIAFACDVVLAADDAKLGSPFARIGAVLDSGAHRYLVERLGPHRTLELIYTGRLLSGADAAAIGLVNRSVPRDALHSEALSLARTIAAGPTAAFAESKRIVRALAAEAARLPAVLAAEGAAQGRIARSVDYAEGITAFQDKRTPEFTGH
ncbi:MAG: enoyl-CoA hydratase-related protein [Actinomycetota bacterium]|nr:enoyl-CoA hydratase/isomerase family protein [Acidimicrobiia bacterium]MDQ3469514.1 enoyl-CoA hydratase-related protein [Actinomycetota bacterium]